MRLPQADVRHLLGVLDDLYGLLARHAPLRGVALDLESAGPVHGHALLFSERLEVELQPNADIGVLSEAAASCVDRIELVHGVDVDAEAILHGHLDLLLLFVGAVEHQGLGIGPR